MAKPVFPGCFFLFHLLNKALSIPAEQPCSSPLCCSLAGAVPGAPSLLALLSLVCAAHPSWALAKPCPSPSPSLLHAPAIPPSLFFGPGFPLSYPASSSAPKPGCIHVSSRQIPKRATSYQSHPHIFLGQPRLPDCFAHQFLLLLHRIMEWVVL